MRLDRWMNSILLLGANADLAYYLNNFNQQILFLVIRVHKLLKNLNAGCKPRLNSNIW